mgnify:CR=1 FL=1
MKRQSSVKVGFLPNSNDFTHPQDRRRYVPFLSKLGIDPEIADFSKHYDVLYISLNCDLNQWAGYKRHHSPKKTKIILDLSDNYLADSYFNSVIRSLAHFIFRRTIHFVWDYRVSIQNILDITDLVTVGSLEQQSQIACYHDNVIVIRDYFADDVLDEPLKKVREPNSSVNILWEGFSHGCLPIFHQLREIVSSFDSDFGEINLHVVSDSKICGLMGKFFCRGTEKALVSLFKGSIVNVHFYEWTILNLNIAASNSDFAIIPIPAKPLMRSKPENKLLLFWSLGLPVLVSDTPSYTRVMRDSGNVDCALNAPEEWSVMISEFAKSRAKRDSNLKAGLRYIDDRISYDVMMESWRDILHHDE